MDLIIEEQLIEEVIDNPKQDKEFADERDRGVLHFDANNNSGLDDCIRMLKDTFPKGEKEGSREFLTAYDSICNTANLINNSMTRSQAQADQSTYSDIKKNITGTMGLIKNYIETKESGLFFKRPVTTKGKKRYNAMLNAFTVLDKLRDTYSGLDDTKQDENSVIDKTGDMSTYSEIEERKSNMDDIIEAHSDAFSDLLTPDLLTDPTKMQRLYKMYYKGGMEREIELFKDSLKSPRYFGIVPGRIDMDEAQTICSACLNAVYDFMNCLKEAYVNKESNEGFSKKEGTVKALNDLKFYLNAVSILKSKKRAGFTKYV